MEGWRTGRLDLLSSPPPCCHSGSYPTLLRISLLLHHMLWPRPPLHLLSSLPPPILLVLCFAPWQAPPLPLHLSIPSSDSLASFEPLKAPGRLWKVPVHAFISSLCPAFPSTPPPHTHTHFSSTSGLRFSCHLDSAQVDFCCRQSRRVAMSRWRIQTPARCGNRSWRRSQASSTSTCADEKKEKKTLKAEAKRKHVHMDGVFHLNRKLTVTPSYFWILALKVKWRKSAGKCRQTALVPQRENNIHSWRHVGKKKGLLEWWHHLINDTLISSVIYSPMPNVDMGTRENPRHADLQHELKQFWNAWKPHCKKFCMTSNSVVTYRDTKSQNLTVEKCCVYKNIGIFFNW